MDHETALKLDAAQRYALGELSSSDKDAFEEHLADCSRCMEDVWTGQVFAANARAVFKDRAADPAPKRAGWFDLFRLRPVPLLAVSGALNFAMAGIIVVGLVGVLPRLNTRIRDSQQVTAATVFRLRGMSRGPSQEFAVRSQYAILRLDLPHRYRQYSYSLEDVRGRVLRSGSLPVADQADELDLTVPVAGLDAGEYRLKVFGSEGGQPEAIAGCVIRLEPKK